MSLGVWESRDIQAGVYDGSRQRLKSPNVCDISNLATIKVNTSQFLPETIELTSIMARLVMSWPFGDLSRGDMLRW